MYLYILSIVGLAQVWASDNQYENIIKIVWEEFGESLTHLNSAVV